MNIKLTTDECEFLKIILYADLKARGDAVIHALSHGSQYYDDPGMDVIQGIIAKIGFAEAEHCLSKGAPHGPGE